MPLISLEELFNIINNLVIEGPAILDDRIFLPVIVP